MSDDIHLMIEALESYTGLPWDYLKIAHPFIEKLFKRCAGIISRDDLIEISKTICDRCTMGDKLCDATMNLLSAKLDLQLTCNQLATDTISRQAAIHLITGYNGVMDKSVAKRLLIQMPSAQPEPQWIPCSERLPDRDEDGYSDKVLVCFDRASFTEICEYREGNNGGKWYVGDMEDSPEDVGLEVIAWMPLPEPYEERREE